MVDGVKDMGLETKNASCWASPGCHNRCRIAVDVRDGRIVGLRGHPATQAKGVGLTGQGSGCGDRLPLFTSWLYDERQLHFPLKRVGERGQNQWQRITWDQALDEIADRLDGLKKSYGAESLALIEGTYRSDLYAMRTRFLNLFGNPGNIGCAGTVCMCNKFALRAALLGSQSARVNTDVAKCLVIAGWNMAQSRGAEWRAIRRRLKEESDLRLIVIDPRKTEVAEHAHEWLQIRPGTDTALYMAWIHTIIAEELYDKSFVAQWTHGFDDLCERATQYPPEKVAEITWLPADQIRATARMYASVKPGFLSNYGMATDQIGLNGIRAEQARICLKAITGNLRVNGGETVLGPGPIIDGKMGIRDSMLQLEEKCPPEQRKKQLGSDQYKLMTWPGWERINATYKQTYGIPFSMSGHNFLAPQPLVWQAVLTEKPYPIKALITWTSNPLLNAGDVQQIHRALKSPNLDLHVVLEHFMTPTALLADYVLPAASKLEKPMCATFEDFSPVFMCGERPVQPLGERRSDYDFFRGLAQRLGFGEYFPWENEEELNDYRVAPLGITFKEATDRWFITSSEPWTYETINPRTGRPTGFATPSGKIELSSNVLKELGYDPLPFYEEPPESPLRTPQVATEYPLILNTGGMFRPMFHSENRHFGMGFREKYPDPLTEIHPDTAGPLGISDGDWVYIETRRGVIKQKARVTDTIHPQVVNVQSHWWFPEQPAKEPILHGVYQSNANVLTLTDKEALDPISGGWALRALLCRVYKVE
jgi:anaerobic selenocysteine-containing dehydrogenase